jgi:predicted SAM-dependent methyltransferase
MPMGMRNAMRGGLRRVVSRSKSWLENLLAKRGAQRKLVASSYLSGEGIEIGALHLPLEVPAAAKVRYLDRMPVPELRRQYPELNSLELVDVDIIDDGESLVSVADLSQAFVIANHFIEHCQNPVMALHNMFRVLKPSGILYLAIPDKRYTFDIDRPVTSIDHLLKDYEDGPAWSKRQHFEEWVRVVEKVEDEAEAQRLVDHLIEVDYSIHFHVWTQAEMFELIVTLIKQFGLSFDTELFLKIGTCRSLPSLDHGSRLQPTHTLTEVRR